MVELAKLKNQEITNLLYEIADLLELKGVEFKPQAYRKAAQSIQNLAEDIKTVYKQGKLNDIPGVGVSIAAKIQEILESGSLRYLEDLRKEIPSGLRELMELEGVGPKMIFELHEKLNINNIDELETAVKQRKVQQLKGYKQKTEDNLLKAIELYRTAQKRFLLGEVLPIAREIENILSKMKEVKKVCIAGSIRRKKELIRDVDIIAASPEPAKIMDSFVKLSDVKRVISHGKTKTTVILRNNLQVDLRIVEEESFGTALQYFTGSKEHNIRLRSLAREKNLKLSEYGLFHRNTDRKIAGKNEEETYNVLGLGYIEPELRENRGEIEAALTRKLPQLVVSKDIKGDLHIHTNWSEGSHSLAEMVKATKLLGYKYVAICDHAKSLQIAHGMTEEKLRKQIQEIEQLNRKQEDITIFTGVEANIDVNGRLDVSNAVLKDLDLVIASVHSAFKQSEEKMTERILTAIHNEHVNVLGHPTGRLLNKREPYKINIEKIFEAAARLGVFMEINSSPSRLDLPDFHCFQARKHEIKFSIVSDAHSKEQLRYMELGVAVARRGWLEKNDIVNTLGLREINSILKS
ncbi:MAG: DNA polymerase/3'-5' exonuclease PolX [Candidatus Hodarchaeota archaeon]